MRWLKNWFQERLSQFEQRVQKRAEVRGTSKTFIVPTAFGFGYALTCFILLLAAVIYQNNLIFLSMFSMVAIALHCMYLTNHLVQKAELNFHSQEEFFAEDIQQIRFVVRATEKKVELHLGSNAGQSHAFTNDQKEVQLTVPFRFHKRGLHNVPLVRMSSTWPLGLFRSWKWARTEDQVLVFPEKVGELNFPQGAGEQAGQKKIWSQENFNGFRPWHSGISFRLVDWRIYSRLAQFMYADFSAAKGLVEIHLSLPELLEKLPLEKALSQMTVWIEQAHRQGYSYQLDLGIWQSGMQNSTEHRQECLLRLAEWT